MAQGKSTWDNPEIIAGAGTAAATVGLMGTDLRSQPNLSRTKKLGSTWNVISKHVQPGDVIIGSFKRPHEVIRGDINDVVNAYKKLRKQKKSIWSAASQAASNFDIASILSKGAHPWWSHAAVFATKTKLGYGGGGKLSHGSEEMAKDIKELKTLKRTHQTPHYILVRPKDPTKNKILQIYKTQGAKAAEQYVQSRAGYGADYGYLQGIKAGVIDAIKPKFGKKEYAIKVPCTKGGICSTLPAAAAGTTVGGKTLKNVVPKDFLHSKDYEIVGRIGPKLKPHLAEIPFYLPRAAAKGAIGLATGGAVYEAVKKYREHRKES